MLMMMMIINFILRREESLYKMDNFHNVHMNIIIKEGMFKEKGTQQ